MLYRTIMLIAVFILMQVSAFLEMAMIPVYDSQTEKRFLFPEKFIQLVLEKQRLLYDGDFSEEIYETLDKEGRCI